MIKVVKLFAIALIIIFSITKTKAQLGVSTYSLEAFGINTSSKYFFSADVKIFANREYEYMNFDFSCLYNFKQKTYHRLAIGAG